MQTNKQKQWYEANKERLKTKQKEYYKTNKESVTQYRIDNKDKIKKSNSLYITKNKDKVNEKRRAKHKEKLKTNNLYRIKHNIRSILNRSFKSKDITKLSKSELILGCSFNEFKIYLESKFEHWMSWDNYGLYNGSVNFGWDIDHIEPLANAKTIEDVIRLNHYTNLQPLCSFTNRYVKKNN